MATLLLINRFNLSSELESDLLQLWQSELPLLAPLYINQDEVIKEATAFRNVAINCAPYSVANDDFETLAGWLVSRASIMTNKVRVSNTERIINYA